MTTDSFGREINYLRISLTDRCNLRCVYCMPEEGVPSKGHEAMLSIEEIERFVAIAASEGITHLRLTGGEPLVRLGVTDLIDTLKHTTGIESVALTSNGILLPRMAGDLKRAGLDRVNISLDTLDAEQYRAITRRGDLAHALAGIDAALEHHLDPVKLNVVVVRSLHQDFLAFARMTLDRPLHVRFIEYMPVGDTGVDEGTGWTREDTIPSEELHAIIDERTRKAGLGPLIPVDETDAPGGWGPAVYNRLEGAEGTVGFIAALSNHFCSQCNRLRLTADGKLRPCLFSDTEFDVLDALRNGDDESIRAVYRAAVEAKPDGHHDRVGTSRKMSQIGG